MAMNDLQSLVKHPSVQGGEQLLLVSGQPIVLSKGGAQKTMGNPVNNQQLMAWLKASLPVDVMGQFQWGRDVQVSLPVDGHSLPMRVVLGRDKSFRIEIRLISAEQAEPAALTPAALTAETPTVPVQAAPVETAPAQTEEAAVDEERLDAELANLGGSDQPALLVCPPDRLATFSEVVGELGCEPKHSDYLPAVLESLKYTVYPFILLQPAGPVAQDPVYQAIAAMNMEMRRRQFVVLFGDAYKTGDVFHAFCLSVNLVVHPRDLGDLAAVIEKHQQNYQKFVAPLHRALQDAGKF
ncbi:hypothetical protein [Acanthopleuribacter pedis]|uniref:Uncharacterized protein n=1 Tax=Acanthopleuribacter pedis TaxID=442870 RepID=A0A8J7QCM1_9BACT|nr:hypothetical protein [Acanthopleuribacter pedis]MBO1322032.1 hypothetical protein [Acanthopleuribacter pedis]